MLLKVIGILSFFISIFSNFIIKDIRLKEWGPEIIFGEGVIIFFGIISFITFLVLAFLSKKYFKLSKLEKLKVQYLLIGGFIFALVNLAFNVISPVFLKTYKYYQFGDISTIFPFAFIAYAIVKRELFGIKVVITAIFVSLIAILLALDALLFTSQLSLRLFKGGILVLFLYFGYLLIKSVILEIKRREEIEKLSRAKSEFISIASHQLRTPLTAIKGYISMVLEGTYGKIPLKARKPMERVNESNNRLIRLVNNLLSVSRIESGKLKMNWEETSIENVISSVLDIFEIEAKEKNIYLKFKKPKKPLPKILMDEGKMIDAISNVVNNDIKYTEKGGVTVEVKKLKSKVRIIIKDTGTGMTKEEIGKMFESFSRGMAGTRMYTQGAGLGLYISRKFTEMHNGKIWVESEGKNKGSIFYIELPMK